jgi:uncharacterized GH25 family protein/ketosteroid isomerase-like protein
VTLHRTGRSAPRFGAHAAAIASGPLLVLLVALVAHAHDFWLVPDPFQVAEGGTIEVLGQTSSRFPTSEAAVALERVVDARIVAANGEARVTDLSHRGKSLLLRHRPSAPGQYVIGVALVPRSGRDGVARFRRYLELEGAPGEAARLEREGLLQGKDSVSRRTSKYAKTLAQVGRGGPRAFSRAAGQPLEFMPATDPASLRVGDTLTLRLMYAGRAVAGIEAHAGAVDWPTADGAEPPRPQDVHATADAQGVFRLPITRAGLWNIRTIYVVPGAAGSGADWDTHWATFVFQVGDVGTRRATGQGTAQASDSAAAVATVEQFHRALANGDSLGALALMTDDVVVLESGGFENRAEFRSHHLSADIEFARATRSERQVRDVTVRSDAAWVSSTSSVQGEFRGRAVNSMGAELVVLVRTPSGWRISAIHWSSRARRG